MFHLSLKSSLLTLGMLSLPVFGYVIWNLSDTPQTLSTLDTYQEAGKGVKQDFQSLPSLPLTQTDDTYQIQDNTTDGIDIQFANQTESLTQGEEKKGLNLSFPKDYSKPIDIKLDAERSIQITDLGGKDDYTVDTLTQEEQVFGGETSKTALWQKILSLRSSTPKSEERESYLRYTSKDGRKSLLYAYQKDQATGEKKLKHWTLYKAGDGIEHEEYQIDNAKVKINDEGVAEVFYYGDKDIQNEQVKAEVDSNLMERAQRTLEKEMGEDLLNGNKTPDFTIPKPYYMDKQGEKHDAQWKWHEETKSLAVNFTPESYPVALDPTLSFTAPGVSNSGDVITGGASSQLGYAMTSGDFNADGKIDLAVGAIGYSSSTGRVYFFYSDGAFPVNEIGADATITGAATSNNFGSSFATGDFNADGRTDLAVGASGNPGRAYVFYIDDSIPTSATSADVTLTGSNGQFGAAMTAGDFNSDGVIDLAVGAYIDNDVSVFFNDGSSIPASADVVITGEASGYFGYALAAGDMNGDGSADLIVGSINYLAQTGRAYIFYNGSIITENATGADITLTGAASSTYFGRTFALGDFNADGEVDLAVGASNGVGTVYIFYGGSIITENASAADVIITGQTSSNNFGASLTAGDFNVDGRTDLAAGAPGYSTSTGRAYIFYNDGSIPTTAVTADVIITGETTSNSFGVSLTTGDFNGDGKVDLAAGAYAYASNTGRTYIFYSQSGQINTNQSIAGNATSDAFGQAMVAGDFNSDGRTDLAIGAPGYDPGAAANTGRVYIFYGDGQIPTGAATADVTITGNAASDLFGGAFAAGDFDADGKTDLAVGASGYSTNTGRVYIFYGDGSIPTTAGTADVTITGESTSNYFGYALAAGDLNTNGKTDLAVGAYGYSTDVGRTYIFNNDGTYTSAAGSADTIITGGASNNFGKSMATGDFNSDGRTDIIVTSRGNGGWVYVSGFYNDGSIPATSGTADFRFQQGYTSVGSVVAAGDFNADGRTDIAWGVYPSNTVYLAYNDGSYSSAEFEAGGGADLKITGSGGFGESLVSGDFNADGRTDLAVGADTLTTNTGAAYIFYNDGSIPTTAATADVTITGETTNNYFGYAMVVGDMNGDGRTDLVVGAYGNTSSTGKVYLYETRENFGWQLQEQAGGTLRTGLNTSGQELKITGGAASGFGNSMTTGDLNSDGKPDLIIGASSYSSSTGRVYVFYSDGSLTTGASSADIVITGETTNNLFGYSLTSGDWNADGRTDLAVGAYSYSSSTGRAYIFYNDGSIPTTAATADVTITGESISNYLGTFLTSGDFNADGKTDLAVSAYGYTTFTGRVYIFYNGSITTENASGADVIITGEAMLGFFSISLTSGDFNADGKTDLAVGASGYSSNTGRVYIFYNGSITTENASGADVIIAGSAGIAFGTFLASGDFNADGRVDLAVSATGYSTNTGRAYIFYNDGSIPTTAATADVTITGETTSNIFGVSLASGDWNADGRTDLAVGAYGYSSSTGRAYIFYNDGSIPTTAATADMTLTGEATSNNYGIALASGDFNADGRTDLAVGASGYDLPAANSGRVYMYTFGNDQVITGETTNNYFGYALTSGDFNADGKTDLAVGAFGYSSSTGRVYVFYNDGAIPSVTASADAIITGETASDSFGAALTTGDLNQDGKVDLVVGATGYSSSAGRVYVFYNGSIITENASGADHMITGDAANNGIGHAFAIGDLNSDGWVDLIVTAYSIYLRAVYVFYNDGSLPTTLGTADVTISGGIPSAGFASAVVTGDFNADGRTDLAVGAQSNSSSVGKAYIFYNDGSIPTTTATADVTISGESTTITSDFGVSLASGDLNSDGRTDLIVAAYAYPSKVGRAYIFYNDGSIPTTADSADIIIVGESSDDAFGLPLVTSDLNSDGRTDLAVGAHRYSGNVGQAYLFYNDGSIPTTAANADMKIPGVSSSYFARMIASGDLNSDGRTDLIVGAYAYSTNTGRVYIFASEAATADVSTEPMKTRGTLKTRGNIKIR